MYMSIAATFVYIENKNLLMLKGNWFILISVLSRFLFFRILEKHIRYLINSDNHSYKNILLNRIALKF